MDITVGQETTLKGATIAALDGNGQDNGQLRVTTGTLQVSSLSNTNDSTSLSQRGRRKGTSTTDVQ